MYQIFIDVRYVKDLSTELSLILTYSNVYVKNAFRYEFKLLISTDQLFQLNIHPAPSDKTVCCSTILYMIHF